MLLQVTQNSGGHGHTPNPAVHSGAHHHSPAVQPHGPSVMSGHSHTAAPQASAQGQQFQRLKVSLPILLWRHILCQSGWEDFSSEWMVWSVYAVLPYYRLIDEVCSRRASSFCFYSSMGKGLFLCNTPLKFMTDIPFLPPKGGRCIVLFRPSETAVWQSASGLQRLSGYNERVQVSKVRRLCIV